MNKNDFFISIIGMGYVGLPLANELSKYFKVIGYDINKNKIEYLKKSIDKTKEIQKINKKLVFTNKILDIKNCNIYILCLPTPVTLQKKPDLKIIKSALKKIKPLFNNKDIIILESTYYPGATKELITNTFKEDYKKINVGYSPERINPGDKKNTLTKITKIISSNNLETLKCMYSIYGKINKNNIFKANSIEEAEAAKLIENVQRDLNIGLMNELTKIFDKLDISIHNVLAAANTKWNFLDFKPGLVGGHCIGVDPYYLKYICKKINFEPRVFMSARNTNEEMTKFYFKKISKYISSKDKVLYLGLSFKENTNDLRNSKNLELLKMLSKKNKIHYYDSLVKSIQNVNKNVIKYKKQVYDIIILAVPHKDMFKFIKNNLKNILKDGGYFIDLNNNYKLPNKTKYKHIKL